jgi:hypothetical protein
VFEATFKPLLSQKGMKKEHYSYFSFKREGDNLEVIFNASSPAKYSLHEAHEVKSRSVGLDAKYIYFLEWKHEDSIVIIFKNSVRTSKKTAHNHYKDQLVNAV